VSYYDRQQNPMVVERVLATGALFSIAVTQTREGIAPLVGLFIEDDTCYHLKATFDANWLADLTRVAQQARNAYAHPRQADALQRLLDDWFRSRQAAPDGLKEAILGLFHQEP
jgi:hypothetical protein